MLRNRLPLDLILSASIAALPWLAGIRRIESGRILFIALVYSAVALLGKSQKIGVRARLALDSAVAAVFFTAAWLLSFPAADHTSEIGLNILFGVAVLVVALTSKPQPRRAPALESLLAIWNLG